jgi:hypothetical protein
MHTLLIRWGGDEQELVRKIARTAIRVGRAADATTMYQGSTRQSPDVTVHIWKIGGGWVAEVRLTFDEQAKAIYLNVQSPEAETEARVFGEFARRLEAIPVEEVIADVVREGDQDAQQYVRLALATGAEYSEEVKELVSASLRDGQPNRRRGAALAVGLLLWPEFLDGVVEALEVETDEGNRALMTVAYRQIDAEPPH